MTQISPIYIHDATPSWNGFNYQGTVGIYTFFKYYLETTVKEDFSSLILEYEWLEDFAIKKNGKYVSIHQVKAYKNEALNGYTDAVIALCKKLLGIFPLNRLRTILNTDFKKDALDDTIKDTLKLLIEKKILAENNKIIGSETDIDHLDFSSLSFSENLEKTLRKNLKFYNRLSTNLDEVKVFLHTAKYLKNFNSTKLLKSAPVKKFQAEIQMTDKEFKDLLDRITLYDYEKFSTCDYKWLKNETIEQLNNFLKKSSQYLDFGNKESAEKAYVAIQEKLIEHIASRHEKIWSEKTDKTQEVEELNIQVLINILQSDKLEEPTVGYVACKLKEEVEKNLKTQSEYIQQETDNSAQSEIQIQRLTNRIAYIFKKYPHKKLLAFGKIINPNIKVKQSSDSYRNLIPEDGFCQSYLHFFSNILANPQDNEIQECEKKFYLTSAINKSSKYAYKVAREIYENSAIPEMIFEANFIINENISKVLSELLQDITKIAAKDSGSAKYYNNITKIKALEFIKVEEAIKKFNDAHNS